MSLSDRLPVPSDLPPGQLYLSGPRRCGGCGFPPEHCFCAQLPQVRCHSPILVVRHASERRKASNTGGLAAKVLGLPWVDHGLPHRPLDLSGALGPRPRVLLPHGSEVLGEPPSTLVVLDATWQQARAMRARIPPLATAPLWSLPAAPARPRMRAQHLPEGRSTMEALADALDRLGEPEPARVLRALYAELTDRWLTLRQSPTLDGRSPAS